MSLLSRRAERALTWAVLVAGVLLAAAATRDAWRQVGRTAPGAGIMRNLLVVPFGGADPGPLRPLDLVVAVNGRQIESAAELHAEVDRHPPGSALRYAVLREGAPREIDVRTHTVTVAHFRAFLLENLAHALVLLGLGVLVIRLKPGAPDSRVFLLFCVVWFGLMLLYHDLGATNRFTSLFYLAWALAPAAFAHLALTFPERGRLAARHPGVVAVPYALSAGLDVALEVVPAPRWTPVATIVLAYLGASLVALVLALANTRLRGASPLGRQRAGVLMLGFTLAFGPPVLGAVTETMTRVSVPALRELWWLTLIFPLAVAYAIVRYDLFDIRAALRAGAVYSAVTALLAAGYAGVLTLLNLPLFPIDPTLGRVVPAAVAALVVVFLVNPAYVRTRAVVDRLFFRERYDAQQAIERLAAAMTTVLDLERVVPLIADTLASVFHPAGVRLLLAAAEGREYRSLGPAGRRTVLAGQAALVACLARHRQPLSRERLEADPALAPWRDAALAELTALGAAVVVPVRFRGAITALLVLGPKRTGAAYTGTDLRLLRVVADQSAVALENARAYFALQTALRRVETLEAIRRSLAKFVPRTVQDLIEQAPGAPALDKHAVDVSVLFVDIAGYTRISERMDATRLNHLVERYFGAFLDEIWKHGGDVNETAGDGLMVIFQDPDPWRHAHAAVATGIAIVERARRINAELAGSGEPIALHVGVNSGVAAVGATKIEGTGGSRWTYTASGPVTNMAARLAALGEGDAVIIGAETRARLGDAVVVDDLGEQRLRNVEAPVRAYRLRVPAGGGRPPAGRGVVPAPTWPIDKRHGADQPDQAPLSEVG